jgi:hypothetical protein
MALSESELLDHAAAAGAVVGARQLRRWRAAGLVPTPEPVHERGRPGSRSEYEGWVVEQLIVVADLLAETRSVRYAAIELWWSRRWVRRSALREALLQPLDPLRREVERLAEEVGDDPLDLAEAIAERAEDQASDHGGWGMLGARLGPRPDDRHRVNLGLAMLSLGQDVPWDVTDEGETSLRDLFARAIGLERATTDVIGETPWLAQMPVVEDEIAELTGGLPLDPRDIGDAIANASDEELDQARDIAHWIIESMAPAAAAQEALLGTDVGGLGSIRELAERSSLADTTKLVLMGLAAARIAPDLAAAISASASDGGRP